MDNVPEPAKDLMVASRTNEVGASITQLAGSTLKFEDHAYLPLSYMICEIEYGYTLPLGSSGFRGDFDESVFTRKLSRAGTEKVRVCVFHLTSSIARGKISLAHEALATMVTDCLFYQTDILAGDANMALYRYGGTNQKSMDIQGGMYQSIIAYFLEAYKKQSLPFCCPKVRHVSANSLYVLKQYEDALGQPFRDCPPIDWNVFPGLDPLVCSIFEWGHSLADDEWSEIVGEPAEYRLGVSEWVLNSDQSNYLLGDRDNDSHTPLLVDILPQHMTLARRKERDRKPQSVIDAAQRRKDRQRENKRMGWPSQTGGSRRPAEPEAPPSGRGSTRPTEPDHPPPRKGKDKGSQKGHYAGYDKGKTKGKGKK